MTHGELNQHGQEPARRRVEHKLFGSSWDWRSAGAFAGLSGGVVCGVFGCVFVAISWVTSAGSAYTRSVGTTLLVLMLPLLAAGAHCLDLTEKRKKREREERFS